MYAKHAKLAGFVIAVVVGSTALTASQPTAKAGPASAPVVVSKSTSSAPTPPAGENVTCNTGPNSPSPDGPSSTCPVVQANGRTFWPFNYNDNRYAIDVVGYDSTGAKVSQQQVNGPRYIWQVTVDANTQTVGFWGQSPPQASLPWSAFPPPLGAPVVASKSTSSAPTPPAGENVTCNTGPNSPSPDGPSSTCPVVQANGRTFWPFNYNDNRYAIDVVGYDSTGAKVSQQQVNGPRYIWQVTVDANTQTVAFWGQQGTSQGSLPWSAFPPPPGAPVVVSKSTSSAPTPPAGETVACMTGPNSPSPDGPSSTCPVVQADGRSFWPFNYNDNREAIDVVGYDSTGAKVSQQQLNGARSIWRVTVDSNAQTVGFWGQSTPQASLPWSAFAPH